MKKSIILAAVLLVVSAGQVSARTRAVNKDTGYKSFNMTSVNNLDLTRVSVDQDAVVINGVVNLQNTGLNDASYNTKLLGTKPAIQTGSVDTYTSIQNNVNRSKTLVSTCGCEGDGVAINDQTGASSFNVATVKNIDVTSVGVDQDALVVNVVANVQNTGGNRVNYNTKVEGSGVSSGDAISTTFIENDINSSFLMVGSAH